MSRRHAPSTGAASVLAHLGEIVLATSGEDPFEVALAVAAGRLLRPGHAVTRAELARLAKAHPELELRPRFSDDLLACVDGVLARAFGPRAPRLEALDALFESLASRIGKGEKGQFFTPRHVVDFVVDALRPEPGEVVADPACGSGAFLGRAWSTGKLRTWGCEVDPRPLRVARLLAIAAGRSTKDLVRGDGLRVDAPRCDVVATNPPFAGRADASGFEVARVVRTPERDVLFLERSLALLRPGGRLGIVLPYNKASGAAYARMRHWLLDRARLFAVVALPRETFLPHTSQRTVVLFAKKRARSERMRPTESVLFVLSERAGKDHRGDPVLGRDGELNHDLTDVGRALGRTLRRGGFYA